MEKKKKKTQTDHFLNNETGEIKLFGWGHHLFGICDQLAFFHVVSTKRQMCFKDPDNPPQKGGCWRLMAVAEKEKEVGHGYRVLICVCFCF